ncbi:unnamed protein product [Trichogramma brassicae]|uniref:Uncharacterized protein n=1 Tax=Trichogramma brassicae TaxID=86971 RepID=A0A6H5HY74_9HYME|nr:unnamed protein product [Trichogramma brassicae]
MFDLHNKFKNENSIKVSYRTFTRYRPPQCVPPSFGSRDTCACNKHENFLMLVQSLHSKGLIKENTDYQISRALTCNKKRTENCYSRKCSKCMKNEIKFNINQNGPISYRKWITRKETRINEWVPFVIYADFECVLKPVTEARAYSVHEAFSCRLYLKCNFDDELSEYRCYRKVVATGFPGRVWVLPQTKERYISFVKFMEDQRLSFRFIDSFKFMSSSLDNLAKNLKQQPT